MRITSVLSHSAQAILEGALIALLVVGLMAGTALAAKPTAGSSKHHGGSTSGSLALKMVTDADADGAFTWGDTITFVVNSTATYPYVSVTCKQGSTLVYGADAGFYPSYPWPGAQNMTLSSPSWTGGAAACAATLNGNPALTFSVGA